MRRALGLVTLLIGTTARADFARDFVVRDESKGACACTYVVPAGLEPLRAQKANTHGFERKTEDTVFSISALPATETAAAYVTAQTEPMPDCAADGKREFPVDDHGWMCGEGGGCNGQWNFRICAQTRPHPKSGQQLIVVLHGSRNGDNPPLGEAASHIRNLNAKSGALPTNAAAHAKAHNARGMKAYKAHDLVAAQNAFREAIAADPELVVAHYNAACVASLLQDAARARTELQWLAQSPLPDAKQRLLKGRTDTDLQFVRAHDDASRALLGL